MRRVVWLPAILAGLFGLLIIHYTGIEADEAFFSTAFYGFSPGDYTITVFHHRIPLMIYPYAGALKALLYWPLLHVFGANAYSVRVPVVVSGIATVVFFFWFAEKIAGVRAALIASLLLATDPSFLLTNTYDYGPVALEHLLLVAGCLLIASEQYGWGFFLFGLALWNKAVFIWALIGLAAGSVAACFPQRQRWIGDRRRVAISVGALIVGAAPLIIFNLHAPNATLQANVHPSFEGFQIKLVSLNATLNGSALFGVMVAQENADRPKNPRTVPGRMAWWIRQNTGIHYSSLMVYAMAGAALLALCWRPARSRAALFSIAFLVVAFIAMAGTRYTGPAHHIVLLYPMPQLLVGIAVSALPWRSLMTAVAVLLIGANLLVLSQYISQFERNGTGTLFTDALYPLSDALDAFSDDHIHVVDWGIAESVNLLHRGQLHLVREWTIQYDSEAEQHRRVTSALADPQALFLTHTRRLELYDVSERVTTMAQSAGYERVPVRTVTDSNGRPVFDLFRFEKIGSR